jgi:hypothetical protein
MGGAAESASYSAAAIATTKTSVASPATSVPDPFPHVSTQP